MLISKTIEVKWNSANKKYYANKGYKYTKMGDTLLVDIKDLSKGSNSIVKVKCDYCGVVHTKRYTNYTSQRKKYPKDACGSMECMLKKQKENHIEKYGVDHPIKRKEVRDKLAKTNINRYGADNVFKLDKFQEKAKQSVMDKYGVDNVFASPEIKRKISESNIKKYGCPFPLLNEEIKKKADETKARKGEVNFYDRFPRINGVAASKDQIKLSEYLNGQVNHFILGKFVDIYIEEHNVAIEYDGGGHYLNVITGKISHSAMMKKEEKMQERLINAGYKFVRISNLKDKKFSFEYIKEQIDDFLKREDRFLMVKIS